MTWTALRGRRLPVERIPLPLDRAAHEAASRAVQEAAARGDADAVASARAALDALPVLAFVVRTLPPAEWEALIDAHPATDEQRERGWAWNADALRFPALAAAVTLEGEEPVSAEQWRKIHESAELSPGEFDELYGTVLQLNTRSARVSLGNG